MLGSCKGGVPGLCEKPGRNLKLRALEIGMWAQSFEGVAWPLNVEEVVGTMFKDYAGTIGYNDPFHHSLFLSYHHQAHVCLQSRAACHAPCNFLR